MSAVKNLRRRGFVLILALAMCLHMARTTVSAAGGGTMSSAEFLALANGNGVITLRENVTLTGQLEIARNLTLTVEEGVTLTLPRCDEDLVGSSIRVSRGGKLTINGGGSIISPGPVLLYADGGEVEIQDGSLRALCTVLQIQGGKASVSGGTLSAGSGPYYQTVYVDHSAFTLTGGTIENTTYGGGAITVCNSTSPHSKSTVTIRGGNVVNRGEAAAALSIEDESDVRIYGGTLTNQGADAAALFIVRKADVLIDGGKLENTAADTDSVALFEYDQSGQSTITISGGSLVSKNGKALQIMYGSGTASGNANIVGTAAGNAMDAGKFTVSVRPLSAKLLADGKTVALTGNVPDNATCFYAASYENGRMTRIVSGNLNGSQITFSGSVAAGARLFLLDAGYSPVCAEVIIG